MNNRRDIAETLSGLERQVFLAVRQAGQAQVNDVLARLAGDGRDLAYTTVLSALQTLEEKGYVSHEAAGRAYRYAAAIPAERAGRSAIARIKDAIFQGSSAAMLTQIVSDERLDRAELERMRALLDARLDARRDAPLEAGE